MPHGLVKESAVVSRVALRRIPARRGPPRRSEMRKTIALVGWILFCVSGCRCHATFADKFQPAQPIATVIVEKERAGLRHARILIEGEKIASVHLHGWRYLAALRKLDTSLCPEKFRLAWSNYISAWDQKLKQEHATEETLDAVSMWKGTFDDLPATSRRIEPYDTDGAWQQCERVALEYGIDPSKLSISPDRR